MISEEQTKHIASLARINMSEEEVKKMAKELSVVLDYFKKLEEVDISGIDPTLSASHSINVFRADEDVLNSSDKLAKKLVNLAPSNEDGYIKVKSILK